MSLMDSVFDVRAALEGKPEAKLFEEIEERLWEYEEENDILRNKVRILKEFKELLKDE